jgi:HAD superfamily hydrolase (TIGR01509 family)
VGAVAVGGVRAADIDAVTLDAHGTMLGVVDPLPRLCELLPDHDPVAIAEAFRAEGRFYREHVGRGTDASSLAGLQEECVGVFNRALGSRLTAEQYVDTIRFELLPGVVESLERLRSLGLSLAVAGNWDFSLHERLAQHGLAGFFATVVHAARKPDPDGLRLALSRLQVRPGRALHIGDEDADEQAARAVGMHFARTPLVDAVAAIG